MTTEFSNDPVIDRRNLLMEPIEYKMEVTEWGTWRRFMWSDGKLFEEFRSHGEWMRLPLLHYTKGRSPETGKWLTAVGVIAVGRKAIGIVAIGQASFGVVAIGQLALGLLFGLGQASTGLFAIGQLALGGLFGLGQLAIGYAVVGQLGIGHFVVAQTGYGAHVWDQKGRADPAALQFFQQFL